MRTVGVLALQGDVREHVTTLENLGATARKVRREADLAGIDGLESFLLDDLSFGSDKLCNHSPGHIHTERTLQHNLVSVDFRCQW